MSIPYSRYVFGQIPWYGFLIAAGMLSAVLLCIHEEKRRSLPRDTVIDLAFWIIPFGLIGARLYYVIFQWEAFSADPITALYIWEGGLAIYGGVIGGFLAILLFARRRKCQPFMLTDMIVPGLSLAQAIGRWGNYFNMEAYGVAITDPTWQFFPVGVQIPGPSGYTWHMATFFYESVWDLAVFLVLWFIIRKRTNRHGITTLWYCLLYGFGRFLIEGLRTDSLMSSDIRVSQLLSLILVLMSAGMLIYFGLRNRVQTNKGG